MSSELIKEQSKCPFTGAGTPSKHPTGRGTSNRDWWPNSLNLKNIIATFFLSRSNG